MAIETSAIPATVTADGMVVWVECATIGRD